MGTKKYDTARIQWGVDEKGTLTIKGTGRMPGYNYSGNPAVPWEDRKEEIREVVIGEGITQIGIRTFENLPKLSAVHLPASLTRIGACAFKNCFSLCEVTLEGEEDAVFRFVFDKTGHGAEREVVFGVQSFHAVPWAEQYFKNCYVAEGILYTTFSCGGPVVVPEGVRCIAENAFMESPAREVFLPESLESIEERAFWKAKVRKLHIRNLKGVLSKLAFFESSLECIDFEFREGTFSDVTAAVSMEIYSQIEDRRRGLGRKNYAGHEKDVEILKVESRYDITTKRSSRNREFEKLIIKEKKDKTKWSEVLGCICQNGSVNTEGLLKKRLQEGEILFNIVCFKGTVLYVRSMAWDERTGHIYEYMMYPCLCTDADRHMIKAWSDSLHYRDPEILKIYFPGTEGRTLIESRTIRNVQNGFFEEWYTVKDQPWIFGGSSALKFLYEWSKNHPRYHIDSEKENRAKDKYRKNATMHIIA